MQHTLTMYPNQQHNSIKINDYTILEFYKDSVSPLSRIGYYILPIEGLNLATIEEKIGNLAEQARPSGYTNYQVLPDRLGTKNYSSYDHRICYVVFYNGTTVPTYPAEPAIGETETPAVPFNPWNEVQVNNVGMPTYVTLSFTLDSVDGTPIVFYVNEDKFLINVVSAGTLKISNNGIYLNDTEITDFELSNWPYLISGMNTIKVPKKNISHLKVDYTAQY